jgi:SAM-dependent methyltransferase
MLTAVTGTADHVLRNRAAWDRWAADYAGPGLRRWAVAEPSWGLWNIPEAQVGLLPADVAGRDSIELGCGTGYISAWLARRGARPAGLDNSAEQLATARQLQDRFGLRFPLVHASAERVPFADASFDLAISEYGASIWCDPYRWIPEAARLLRPRRGADLPVELGAADAHGAGRRRSARHRPAAAAVLRHAPVRMAR